MNSSRRLRSSSSCARSGCALRTSSRKNLRASSLGRTRCGGRTGCSVSIATASGNRPSESIQPCSSSSTPGMGMTRARASCALRRSSASPVRAARASAMSASSSSSREYIGPSLWWCRREKLSTSTRKVSTAISNSINACSAARTARSSRASGRASSLRTSAAASPPVAGLAFGPPRGGVLGGRGGLRPLRGLRVRGTAALARGVLRRLARRSVGRSTGLFPGPLDGGLGLALIGFRGRHPTSVGHAPPRLTVFPASPPT